MAARGGSSVRRLTLAPWPRSTELSRADARRIALQAQLLTKERPAGVLDTVRSLSLLQIDLTPAVAPSADLVLWSRLGSTYSPQELRDAVDEQRADRAARHAAAGRGPGPLSRRDGRVAGHRRAARLAGVPRDWVTTNDACRRDILDLLRAEGPLPAEELPDTCVRPWRSTGWNNNKNVSMMLDLLVQRGEVAVAGREGRQRLWDLAERVYPDDPGPDPSRRDGCARSAAWARSASRGRADRTAPWSPSMSATPASRQSSRAPAVSGGSIRRSSGRTFAGRAALLSPFDRLLHDRKRMIEVFEFDYLLEMYKPESQRIWGYYALPILYGDRLVGKLDATTDRDAGVLRVAAIHQDVPFSKAMNTAVNREIADLARWLEVDLAFTG